MQQILKTEKSAQQIIKKVKKKKENKRGNIEQVGERKTSTNKSKYISNYIKWK